MDMRAALIMIGIVLLLADIWVVMGAGTYQSKSTETVLKIGPTSLTATEHKAIPSDWVSQVSPKRHHGTGGTDWVAEQEMNSMQNRTLAIVRLRLACPIDTVFLYSSAPDKTVRQGARRRMAPNPQ